MNPEGPYVLEQFVSVPPLFMQTSEESIYFETSAFIFESCSNYLVTVVNSADKVILQLVLLY